MVIYSYQRDQKKDGVYQVRDTMNPKYVNYVDILESINVKLQI